MFEILIRRRIRREDQGDYMERWGIKAGLLSIYVHKFIAADTNERMHDHPWASWYSLVLRGWVNEMRYTDNDPQRGEYFVRRMAGSISGASGNTLHRIVGVDNARTWTLFIGWRRVRDWGFH